MIKLDGLTKKYGDKIVLDNITFELSSNQIVGLLGANGVGKTTLLKILMGMVSDYSGSVLIDGKLPSPATKAMVAFLPENNLISNWSKVKTAVAFYNDMYADFDDKKAYEMLNYFKLDVNQRLRHMSRGMIEKLGIALILSRQSKVYLLDEPLGGVDPAARQAILESIIKNYASNALLILSTHLIADIEPYLDRVLMLKEHKLVLNEPADDIRARANMSIDDYFRALYKEDDYVS